MTGAPDAYESYAATRTEPRFTDWLRERSEPTWTAAVEHPFTRELAAGTLREEVYAEYLVRDYAFVDALTSAFGYAVGQAPTVAARRPLVGFLDTLTDEENDYFERSFAALDVPESRWRDAEPSPTGAALEDLLGRAAREGGYAETLAVLAPAEWIYAEWATAVADEAADDLPFYYAEWIDLHAVDPFVEFVEWLRGQLDAVGPELSTRRRRRVERLFGRTVDLEVAFFDDAYAAAPDDSEPTGEVV